MGLLSLFLVLVSGLVGCSFPMEEAGLFKTNKNGLPEVGTMNYADQKITFDVLKETSLHVCLKCHTTGKNAMGTPQAALALSKSILDEVNGNQMPPKQSGYKSLTDCEKKILETWFEDQSRSRESGKIKDIPQCAGVTAPPKEDKPDFDKIAANYENLKKYILAPKCFSCHAHDVEDVKTVLDSLATIHDENLLGATAEESKLYQMICQQPNVRCPHSNQVCHD